MAQVKNHFRHCPQCQAMLISTPFENDCEPGIWAWSDGKLDTNALPSVAAYGKCPKCDHVFQRSSASRHTKPVEDAIDQFPFVVTPNADDYRSAINAAQSIGNVAIEKELRITYWRHLNDAQRIGHRRPKPKVDKSWILSQAINMTALLDLLDVNDEHEHLYKGEILRRLSAFDESLRVLSTLKGRHQWLSGLISMHAASGYPLFFGMERIDNRWVPVSRS